MHTGRSQAEPRPAGAGAAERTTLLALLTARTTDAAHDLFTLGPGLGHLAGNTYAHTTSDPQRTHDLARALGATPGQMLRVLTRLTAASVLVNNGYGWHRSTPDRRQAAARPPQYVLASMGA